MGIFDSQTTRFTKFLYDIRVIYELSKRDFQAQYRSSYLGYIWALLLPLVFTLILYLVFSWGMRAEWTASDMPFTLYLVTGIISWNYFSTNTNSMVSVISKHSFLLKEVGFRILLLPAVPLLSSLVVHLFQLIIVIGLCWYEGYAPTMYTFQVLYYIVALQAMLMGLGWLISAASVFVPDVAKIVEVVLQFGFWMTPVFWSTNMIPLHYHWIIQLNPVYYILTGYRDSLVTQSAFWDKPSEFAYFWLLVLLFAGVGYIFFRKLSPHLSEVMQ